MKMWVKDSMGYVVYSYVEENEENKCEDCLSKFSQGICKNGRYAYGKSSNDLNYFFCNDERTTAKHAKHLASIFISAHFKISNHNSYLSNRLYNFECIALHNAKKITSDIGLKINRLVSEEELSKSPDKISLIEVRLKSSSKEAARDLWSIMKSLNQIDYEFNSLESYGQLAINKNAIASQELTRHKAHTLLLMSFYLHEDDFSKNNIKFDISTYSGYVNVDFAVARSAISQILSNAIKYCKPNSRIITEIYSVESNTYFKFKMCSRFFTNTEKIRFTAERYRGKNSAGTKGQGLGLFAASQMMRLNLGGIDINSDESSAHEQDGISYSNNEFVLKFLSA